MVGSVQDLASPSPSPSTTAPATSRQYGKRSLLVVAHGLGALLLTYDDSVVHGSLARAGKVKSQTPKVDKQEKKKTPKGRAKKRILYNRRCVVVVMLSADIVIADILRIFLASSTLRRSLAASVRCES